MFTEKRKLFAVILVITVLLGLYPVSSTVTKLLFCLGVILSAITFIFLLDQRKISLPLFYAFSLPLMCFLLADRPYSATRLRHNYLHSLKNSEGITYVWGGENFLGIDCSGLPRRSIMNALFKESFLSFSSQAFLKALDIWIFDSSAKALDEGYHNQTRYIASFSSIKHISPKLSKGDLAVTQDGVHVLVYLGNDIWKQADPIHGSVHRGSPFKEANDWYNEPVNIVRWRVFDSDKYKSL